MLICWWKWVSVCPTIIQLIYKRNEMAKTRSTQYYMLGVKLNNKNKIRL